MHRQEYEYSEWYVADISQTQIDKRLNEFAANGWRLKHILSAPGQGTSFIFERKYEEDYGKKP